MNEKLKPCPFCGGEAVLENAEQYTTCKGWNSVYGVECQNCSVQTRGFLTRQEAINSWNTRVKE